MIVDWIVIVLLAIGTIFNALGVIGLIRFPDLYTRMHAATKATTFGSIFTGVSVIVYGIWMYVTVAEAQYITLSIHVLIAVIALAFTNAISSHAIARAAHRSGILPSPSVVDRLSEAKQ
jgi:multicomponent Na+:H+ antiporter subunit G